MKAIGEVSGGLSPQRPKTLDNGRLFKTESASCTYYIPVYTATDNHH